MSRRGYNYYLYLCGVAEDMNESFKYNGENNKKAVVIRDNNNRLKIIILKSIKEDLLWVKH